MIIPQGLRLDIYNLTGNGLDPLDVVKLNAAHKDAAARSIPLITGSRTIGLPSQWIIQPVPVYAEGTKFLKQMGGSTSLIRNSSFTTKVNGFKMYGGEIRNDQEASPGVIGYGG